MTDITDFTTGSVDGTGVFDQMMKTVDLHIAEEHAKNRIRGPEYAQVYLGSLQSVMDRSVAYLLSKDKQDLENQILQVRLEMAGIEKDTMLIQKDIATAQLAKATKENLLLDAQKLQIEAQTSLIDEQIASEQKRNALNGLMDQEKVRIIAQTGQIDQQTSNLINQDLQTVAETARINSQKGLVDQQAINAVTEELVLTAQKCKLDAEFDLLGEQKLKAISETSLLSQKKATEEAQTLNDKAGPNSVIGRQMNLYQNQAEGFVRDAEQKTARLLIDTWNVRKTVDPHGVTVNANNSLEDIDIGRAVEKLLAGINA